MTTDNSIHLNGFSGYPTPADVLKAHLQAIWREQDRRLEKLCYNAVRTIPQSL